jgi:hypothetical protein
MSQIVAVNSDPVVANFGPGVRAVHVRNNQVRFLYWHVAINAVFRDRRANLFVHSAFFGLMAGEASA